MAHKTLETFQEKHHAGRVYVEGDLYPAEGYEATEKRIKELTTDKNAEGRPFIEAIEEKEKTTVDEPSEVEEESTDSAETKEEAQEKTTETTKGKSKKKKG